MVLAIRAHNKVARVLILVTTFVAAVVVAVVVACSSWVNKHHSYESLRGGMSRCNDCCVIFFTFYVMNEIIFNQEKV